MRYEVILPLNLLSSSSNDPFKELVLWSVLSPIS